MGCIATSARHPTALVQLVGFAFSARDETVTSLCLWEFGDEPKL